MNRDQIEHQNAIWSEQMAERIRKGRPVPRHVYGQWDQTARRQRPLTVSPDPILDLYVARDNARRSAIGAELYGAIRQRVVSPLSVKLP